jgi:endonuclease YncB( thermonuclease family)
VRFEYPHAVVDRVHDGDTFWAVIDLGMRLSARMKVRLHNVSAVELKEAGGAAARDALAGLLPAGMAVQLVAHDWSYDRLVCDVVIFDGTDVGQLMVKAGHCTVTRGR